MDGRRAPTAADAFAAQRENDAAFGDEPPRFRGQAESDISALAATT